MVYEKHVQQVPYQVCRTVAYQATVCTAHCVEKRIPVTYTCTVPRTVCCRVPVDACGQTVDEPVVPVVPALTAPAPLAPVPATPPADGKGEPHRAQRPSTPPRST
jgi:hypothetical protein